jgi:hypothetical protein
MIGNLVLSTLMDMVCCVFAFVLVCDPARPPSSATAPTPTETPKPLSSFAATAAEPGRDRHTAVGAAARLLHTPRLVVGTAPPQGRVFASFSGWRSIARGGGGLGVPLGVTAPTSLPLPNTCVVNRRSATRKRFQVSRVRWGPSEI